MFLLACPRGYFGNKCTEECNETCAECNNVNGMCESGCIPGWRGYLCNEGSVHNIQFWSGKFQAGYRYINFQNNFNIKKKIMRRINLMRQHYCTDILNVEYLHQIVFILYDFLIKEFVTKSILPELSSDIK